MKIRCPGCKAVLRMPSSAAGHVARCPSCQAQFKVPAPEVALEDTVSAWIEEDIDQMDDELQEQWARRAAEESRSKAELERARLEKNVDKIEKYFKAPDAGGL